MQLNPLTIKQIKRFRSIKRGYYSFLIFAALILFSLFAEIFINNRALIVKYEGRLYFPTYGSIYSGRTFGLDYDYETNYKELAKKFQIGDTDNFVVMPLIPYNPYENDLRDDAFPPFSPSIANKHYLGTDTVGRDIVARLVYGFRISIFFALILLICNYSIGVAIGCAMGYFSGKFDLLFQRVIEIWTNIPFLYVVMIIASIIVPNFWTLVLIMVVFDWTGMTWYLRTATYKEKAREYAVAARSIGSSDPRVMFQHILPNTVSLIITFVPFKISSGIVALTGLDYLGFGLPPPTPSWGELLNQGTENLESIWIVLSVVISMIVVLTMITFIGEAVREALDPKKHTVYE